MWLQLLDVAEECSPHPQAQQHLGTTGQSNQADGMEIGPSR